MLHKCKFINKQFSVILHFCYEVNLLTFFSSFSTSINYTSCTIKHLRLTTILCWQNVSSVWIFYASRWLERPYSIGHFCILQFISIIIYNYEWAKRTKFLLAIIYGSPRRYANSSKTFLKNRKEFKYIFMTYNGHKNLFQFFPIFLWLS